MKKTLFTLLLSATMTLSAWAVPAHPGKLKVKQPDGTELTVRMVGDENFHCYMTLDGVPLMRTTEGAFVYAQMQGEMLTPTKRIAHDKSLRTADEISFIASEVATSDELSSAFRSRLNAANASRRLKSVTNEDGTVSRIGIAPSEGWKGSKKGLVILVEFQDVKFKSNHTRELFDRMFNEKGFNYEGANGSVADYFADQSYGQFTPTFDVVGPVTVSSNMAYYGGNSSYGNDTHATDMVFEAAKAVDSQVNFADYDWDGSVGSTLEFETAYVQWPVGPSGNAETNKGKFTAGSFWFIPQGVEDPEFVYNVFQEITNWYQNDISIRDDQETMWWWYAVTAGDEDLQVENFNTMFEIGSREQFDLWDSLNVEMNLEGLVRGEVTAAQVQETSRQEYQAALDAYFG